MKTGFFPPLDLSSHFSFRSPDKKKEEIEPDKKHPESDNDDSDAEEKVAAKGTWRPDGKSNIAVPRKRVSATLEDFELKNLLGKGAFGEVRFLSNNFLFFDFLPLKIFLLIFFFRFIWFDTREGTGGWL